MPTCPTEDPFQYFLAFFRCRQSQPFCQVVDSSFFLGQVTQFNTSTGSQRFSLAGATTTGPEGEIAFAAWTDDSQSGGDPSGRAVRGRPLAVPPGGF